MDDDSLKSGDKETWRPYRDSGGGLFASNADTNRISIITTPSARTTNARRDVCGNDRVLFLRSTRRLFAPITTATQTRKILQSNKPPHWVRTSGPADPSKPR